MAFLPKMWPSTGPTALSGSGLLIVTGGTNPTITELLYINIYNSNTTTVRTVTLWISTSTTSAVADTLFAVPVGPGVTKIIRGPIVLPSAENFYAKQDTGTDVTLYVTGQEGT